MIMTLIDKDALLAEIERRKKYYENIQMIKPVYESNIEDFSELLSFINTLEVKDVDLDYIKDELDEVVKIHKPNGDFGWGTLYNVATHFFELGLKTQKGE